MTASAVRRLSVTAGYSSSRELRIALFEERASRLVGHAAQIQLEGEALLESIATLHVDGIDAVQALLGGADHGWTLGGDAARHPPGGGSEVVSLDDLEHGSVPIEVFGGRDGRREHHGAHLVLGYEARQMRRRAESTSIDLRQTERRVPGGHDDVGIPDEANASAQAIAVDRRDQRHSALVDRRERCGATAVRAHQGLVAVRALHLLDVDAGVEPLALGGEDHRANLGILAEGAYDARQLVPPRDVERVDGWVAHDDLGDAVSNGMRNGHPKRPLARRSRTCFTLSVHRWMQSFHFAGRSSSSPVAREVSAERLQSASSRPGRRSSFVVERSPTLPSRLATTPRCSSRRTFASRTPRTGS